LFQRIQKLAYQLELIGGIDPEVVREHTEIKSRHEFLETQATDLRKAIADLETVVAELDRTIAAIANAAFKSLNEHFGRFFKHLFGGGKAELVEVRREETDEDGITRESSAPAGIDIIACPPGKKIQSIAMLSGGERAMTAVALLSAIMVTNPSPFVVLDEVDAALDEANAEKYASIVAELAEHTQFIVITHNRSTMRRANVLYGVTMREDGTSQLLSVHLEELEKMREKAEAK
jgi:chromosome segregation protein